MCQYFYIFKFTTQFHVAALTSTVVIVYCRYQGSTRPRPLTFPQQSCSSLSLALGGTLTPPSVKGPWSWKMWAPWTPWDPTILRVSAKCVRFSNKFGYLNGNIRNNMENSNFVKNKFGVIYPLFPSPRLSPALKLYPSLPFPPFETHFNFWLFTDTNGY